MSSTDAEFMTACNAGKAILYIWSILDKINITQEAATMLFIDNNGVVMMGNAQQPTWRTHHMDIKKFVLIDWIIGGLAFDWWHHVSLMEAPHL